MSETLAQPLQHRNPVWLLALGILNLIAGFLALASPLIAPLISVVFIGSILLITGAAHLVHAFMIRNWRGFVLDLLTGLLSLVVGLLILFKPGVGLLGVTLLMASLLIALGAFRLIFSLVHRELEHRWLLALSGLVTLLVGFLIAFEWPVSAFWVLGTFLGIDLLFYGFSLLSLYFVVRRRT
jgi:uncharacterized membrane protein HdeD (DUF308 family)